MGDTLYTRVYINPSPVVAMAQRELHDLRHFSGEFDICPYSAPVIKEKIHRLLYLDPTAREMLDADAVIKVAQQNPSSVDALYGFPCGRCYPLHQAIRLGAPINVIDALCSPKALKVGLGPFQLFSRTRSALNIALKADSSPAVISLLLEKNPEYVRGYRGCKSFHIALKSKKAPVEVMTLFLGRCPNILQRTDHKENTQLHLACHEGASFEVIFFLLNLWPEATMQRNNEGQTPFDLVQANSAVSKDTKTLLSYVSAILGNEERKDFSPNEIIGFFVQITWWKGVRLLIDRHPTIAKITHLDTNIMADYLSMVGHHCSFKTLWEVIRNEQELLAEA